MGLLDITNCALCGSDGTLQESHVLPKFIFRHFKKNSTGYFRSADNPNIPYQDGYKEKMLCKRCEDLFNRFETNFANKFFYPYMNDGKKDFEYGIWLYKFMVSVSWRLIYLRTFSNKHKAEYDSDIHQFLIKNEKLMREYLLGISDELGTIENHIFFFEDIEKAPKKNFFINPHVNIHRSIAGRTVIKRRDRTSFTLVNLMGILLVTFFEKNEHERWERTQIENGLGRIISKDQFVESIVGEQLVDLMKNAEETRNNLSKAQKEKIEKRMKEAGDNVYKYKIFEEALKDRRLKEMSFGVYNGTQICKGADRNQLCPCGSGKKFKHCCGKNL